MGLRFTCSRALLLLVLCIAIPCTARASVEVGGAAADSAECTATTTMLQGILDQTAASGGGWAPLPCGFHATLPLTLPSGVKIGLNLQNCAGSGEALTLGACARDTQQHIIAVTNGTGQVISGVVFDHTNLTNPTNRVSCAVAGGGGARGFVLENSRFMHINMTSQGFSAIQMAGCSGCTVRGNYVPNSGGDALNFNSGEYIITGNVVEDGGDGCIAMNNDAFGVISNNILRRCSLGIGAGPAGSVRSAVNSTPFTITSNLIEDCDYGVLLGWFGYKDRVGPMNCIVSNNIIRRPRSCGIQNNGAPGATDGVWVVQGNQITQAGYTQGRYAGANPAGGASPGLAIYAGSLHDVQIIGNSISGGLGDGIFASGLHFVISGNILSGGPPLNATGITVVNSVDIDVSSNNLRGYGTAIIATDKDTIRIRGNSIDVSHSTAAVAVVVKGAVSRVVVSDNAVTGADHEARCVSMEGLPSLKRLERDNLCW